MLLLILTRKQKHHLEGNAIPAGYCHAHMLLYMSGVNDNINGNYTQLWHNSAADFYVLENFHRKFANLVAPPTM